MREQNNARPVAAGSRADVTSDSSISHKSLLVASQVAAEIFLTDHPSKKRQIEKDRPIDIVPIKAGGCVTGHVIPGEQPVQRHRQAKYKRKNHRLREIDLVFRHLFPIEHGVIPARAEARAFAVVLADHTTQADAFAWIGRNLSCELPRSEAVAIVKSATRRKWKADDLARFIGVTKVIRDEIHLRTIGASDFSRRQRIVDRRRKDKERKRAARARHACGTTTRISIERREPWKDAQISRRTWYRRRSEMVADSGTAGVRNTNKGNSADRSSATPVATLVLSTIGEPQTLDQIVELTGLSRANVKPVLSRLKAAGKARQVRRGVWQSIDTAETGGLQAAVLRRVPEAEQAEFLRPKVARSSKRPRFAEFGISAPVVCAEGRVLCNPCGAQSQRTDERCDFCG